MITWFKRRAAVARIRREAEEREKIARLEAAEKDLQALQVRGEKAVRFLTERHGRNHWRESIQQMIQGGAH